MVYKLPEYKKDYAMRVVCSWCETFLYWSRCHKPNQTSHGICDPCRVEQFEKQLVLPLGTNPFDFSHALNCTCFVCLRRAAPWSPHP